MAAVTLSDVQHSDMWFGIACIVFGVVVLVQAFFHYRTSRLVFTLAGWIRGADGRPATALASLPPYL